MFRLLTVLPARVIEAIIALVSALVGWLLKKHSTPKDP